MATVKEAVHQLLEEFETLSDCTLYIADDLDLAIDNLIAAAKAVAIEEASVGKVSIKHVVAVGNFADDAKITFSKRPQDRVWIDYDLIPKVDGIVEARRG